MKPAKKLRVFLFQRMKHPNLDISAVKSKLRFDKRLLLYLVFFGFASLMWFFNKLGDETNATIRYPVTFINLPMQKVVVNDLPDNLDLNVQGRGFDILRYKMGKSPEPVVINLSRLNHILAKESTMEFNLGTAALFEEIKSQLPANLALSMIQPDTIYFVFSNYGEKRVPVRPVLDLHFDSQCRIDGIVSVTPSMVTVNGPDLLLDTLQAVYTKRITARGVTSDISKNVDLQPIDGIVLIHRKVKVDVPVSKFTEAVATVPITVAGEPDSVAVRLMPNEVTIRYWVSTNDYARLSHNDFKVEADAGQIKTMVGMQLPVTVTVQPANVYNVSVEPQIVNFVLEPR